MKPARPVLGVVVPAHDEQELLGGCLDALARAAQWVGDRAVVRTVVVLDDCRDRTANVARAHGVDTVTVADRRVGRARDAGCAALLAGPAPEPQWLATTDADSRVPPDWLLAQWRAWAGPADARVGIVHVDDWSEHDPATRNGFSQVYDAAGDPHPHVHGANLGVSTEAYRACGGFADLDSGEDVALVAAMERYGFTMHRTRRSPVLTSGRRIARAPGGFAECLAEMGVSLGGTGPDPVR